MTTAATTTAAPTATGPTVRTVSRSARGPVLMIGLLVLAGVLVAALRATGGSGYLDPDAYDPSGSHAVRALLEDSGVSVVRLEGAADVAERATATTTVLVAIPDVLDPAELSALGDLPGELVLVAPGPEVLDGIGLSAQVRGVTPVEGRQPACDLPVAVRAGEVDLGGGQYDGVGDSATGCYASGGAATLLRLTEQRVTLLGDGTFLTNDALDDNGNAALGLGLLGAGDQVLWVVPSTLLPVTEGRPSLWSLYDMSVRAGVLGLVAFVVVLALFRARRLGRVVVEPLPVVVRAAEAVEGRGRLYQAAGARGQAAESLRAGTRDRLTRRLGLPLDAGRGSLVETAAARSGRDPAAVDDLLYGAAPADDAALVRLADDLDTLYDTLTREAAGS